jgi:ornithine decarboxylase
MSGCSLHEAFPDTATRSGQKAKREERAKAKKCQSPALAFLKATGDVDLDPDRQGLSPLPPAEKMGGGEQYAKKKNIGLRGISFHVGSASGDPQAHKRAIQLADEQCTKLLAAGHNANIIDIGGGFVPSSFDLQAAYIRHAILERKSAGLRFIAEPGRFFATEAQDLFVQVIGKKGAIGKAGWRYTIDESLYGQFTNILFDHQHPRWVRIPRREGSVGNRGAGVLFGRTCDSLDVIARSDDMEELEVGDWLWFPHMGAYTTVTASEFNGFPRPPVFMDERLPFKKTIDMKSSVGKIQYVSAVSAKEVLMS